jgi:hypothetical protein
VNKDLRNQISTYGTVKDKHGSPWLRAPVEDVSLAEVFIHAAMNLTEWGEVSWHAHEDAYARADHMLRTAEALIRLAQAKNPEFDDGTGAS